MAGRPNTPDDKVRELQRRLYMAAKRSRERRFHALYDRIWRSDVLREAWKRVRSNRGAAGIDGETLTMIEQHGVAEFLRGIEHDLRAGRYRPQPVRRRYIPKQDGRSGRWGFRRCGIAWCRWRRRSCSNRSSRRTSRTCSYGFRPKRSATQALERIRMTGGRGHYHVVDADIQGFFDTIDQDLLMEKLTRRISDRRVLKLLRQWLRAGVMEDGTVRTSPGGDTAGRRDLTAAGQHLPGRAGHRVGGRVCAPWEAGAVRG